MKNTAILNKMAHLLMIKGSSVTEAKERVNTTTFAQQCDLKIADGELEDIHSTDSLIADMPGIAAVTSSFNDEFSQHQDFNKQAMELKQRRELLLTGWNAYKNFKWSSAVYLSLLTFIITILHIYLLPTFSEMYTSFDASLPYLTSLYFTDGYLAVILLLLIWFFTIGHLIIITVINKRIKKFTLTPSWISPVPMLGAVSQMINQCILLSLYRFIISCKGFVLPDKNDWQLRFNIVDKNRLHQWSDSIYEQLKLALELGIANEYLQEELDISCQQYIDKTTQSMKLYSILGSIVLAVFIGTIVIAMYLPIFTIGLII